MFAKDISEIRKAGNNLKGDLDPFIELEHPHEEEKETAHSNSELESDNLRRGFEI